MTVTRRRSGPLPLGVRLVEATCVRLLVSGTQRQLRVTPGGLASCERNSDASAESSTIIVHTDSPHLHDSARVSLDARTATCATLDIDGGSGWRNADRPAVGRPARRPRGPSSSLRSAWMPSRRLGRRRLVALHPVGELVAAAFEVRPHELVHVVGERPRLGTDCRMGTAQDNPAAATPAINERLVRMDTVETRF